MTVELYSLRRWTLCNIGAIRMINRRNFIAGTGLIGAGIVGTGAAAAWPELARAAGHSADEPVEALLAGIADELLAEYPENATGLGIDRDQRAGLKSRLTDRSPDGQRAIAKRAAQRLERLKAINVATLDEATRIDVDVMRTAHEFALTGFAFPYGD